MRTTTSKRKKTKISDSRLPRVRLSAPRPLLFLGLDPSESRLSDARVAIIPAPFDQTTSYIPGTRFGPRAILEASQALQPAPVETETPAPIAPRPGGEGITGVV